MERGLASRASPVLLRTPTTERNASLHLRPRRPGFSAPWELSAMVPVVLLARHLARRVLERHRTIALSVPPARICSTGAVLALIKMACAPIPI